jgi:hypothetical protein
VKNKGIKLEKKVIHLLLNETAMMTYDKIRSVSAKTVHEQVDNVFVGIDLFDVDVTTFISEYEDE